MDGHFGDQTQAVFSFAMYILPMVLFSEKKKTLFPTLNGFSKQNYVETKKKSLNFFKQTSAQNITSNPKKTTRLQGGLGAFLVADASEGAVGHQRRVQRPVVLRHLDLLAGHGGGPAGHQLGRGPGRRKKRKDFGGENERENEKNVEGLTPNASSSAS